MEVFNSISGTDSLSAALLLWGDKKSSTATMTDNGASIIFASLTSGSCA